MQKCWYLSNNLKSRQFDRQKRRVQINKIKKDADN